MATRDYLQECIQEYRAQQRQGQPRRRRQRVVYVQPVYVYPGPRRPRLPHQSPPIVPGIPTRHPPIVSPPEAPPQHFPLSGPIKPIPVKQPPIRMWSASGTDNSGTLSDLACGCDSQPINVEGSEFKLDPIFKWGVLAALAFIAIKA